MGGVFAKKKFCKLEDESGCMQLLCISSVSAVSCSHAWPACFTKLMCGRHRGRGREHSSEYLWQEDFFFKEMCF